MFSFDEESFLTNVPSLETINFIVGYRRQAKLDFALPMSYLHELLLRRIVNP